MKKKCIKKQKAPSYAFGIEQAGGAISGVGNALGSIGTSIENAADDTSKAAVAGSAFSGLGQGASIGSQIGAIAGPMGQAIGGIVGGVGGLVTGVFTGRKKRQQALRRERRAFQAKETEAGLDNQAQFEQEYWNDNGLAYSFENGGILPNVAWVDNNEILRDNNGNIVQVPNTKPGTDNHLINSTTLESVLSDKLKRPGTNKTFAQEGEKLAKMTKGSKGKDRFAKTADKLNKIHANAKYEQLLAEQAEVQAKKGIKPKMKGVAPAYDIGEEDVQKSDFGIYSNRIADPYSIYYLSPKYDSFGHTKEYVEPLKSLDMINNPAHFLWVGSNTDNNDYLNSPKSLNVTRIGGSKPTVKAAATTPKSTVTPAPLKREFKGELPNKPILKDPGLPSTKAPLVEMNLPAPEESKPKKSFDLSALDGVIPLAANMFAKPEYDSQVFNPYAGAINRAMARRRMNIEPTLAANRRSRAISNRNLANINPNTGANLAARTQAAVSEYAQNADVYATRDNANNQYLADAANMMNNLGQQFVQNTVYTNDLNARNRAAARNFRTKSIENYNNWYQNQQLMKNQKERDKALYPILSDFLQYGIKDEYLAGLNKKWGNK